MRKAGLKRVIKGNAGLPGNTSPGTITVEKGRSTSNQDKPTSKHPHPVEVRDNPPIGKKGSVKP